MKWVGRFRSSDVASDYSIHVYGWSHNVPWWCNQGCCAIQAIRSKLNINPNLVKSRLPITYWLEIQSVWHFVQKTAVALSCSVQNSKAIEQLKRILCTKEISRDLSLRWVWTDIFYCTTPQDSIPDVSSTHSSADCMPTHNYIQHFTEGHGRYIL